MTPIKFQSHTHGKTYICLNPVLYAHKMNKWALIFSLWITYKSKTNMLLFTDLIKWFFLPANKAGQKRSYTNNFILSELLTLQDDQTLKIWWTGLETVQDSNHHPPDQLWWNKSSNLKKYIYPQKRPKISPPTAGRKTTNGWWMINNDDLFWVFSRYVMLYV